MSASGQSLLLLGESSVGKTHYGAQLLRRLMKGGGALRMNGGATNIEPFEVALERLSDGRAADHTAASTYSDSVWPVVDAAGGAGDLVWPEYGGEQLKTMTSTRRVPTAWRTRVERASTWLLMIRLQQTRLGEDVFSRPLTDIGRAAGEPDEIKPSDQARLIELLQMLLFVGTQGAPRPLSRPHLGVLLTCWDELTEPQTPPQELATQLPLLSAFIASSWKTPAIFGLSSLERPLDPILQDTSYVSRGPEQFGFVVLPDGRRDTDLTLPLHLLMSQS